MYHNYVFFDIITLIFFTFNINSKGKLIKKIKLNCPKNYKKIPIMVFVKITNYFSPNLYAPTNPPIARTTATNISTILTSTETIGLRIATSDARTKPNTPK